MRCSRRKRRTQGPIKALSRMARLRLSVAFEAHAGFLHQLGSHAEVVLGGSEIDVPQIRCQLWQETLHIRAGAIPGDESMNRGGVSNVMDTRWVACAELPLNLRDLSKSAK